jgi:hypothetical protein
MFILKAIFRQSNVYPTDQIPAPKAEEYFVTEAWSYEVKWTRFNDINAQIQRASSEPFDDRVGQISLLDRPGQSFDEQRTLFVGCGQNFDRVYVMNYKGQTIDVIKL